MEIENNTFGEQFKNGENIYTQRSNFSNPDKRSSEYNLEPRKTISVVETLKALSDVSYSSKEEIVKEKISGNLANQDNGLEGSTIVSINPKNTLTKGTKNTNSQHIPFSIAHSEPTFFLDHGSTNP